MTFAELTQRLALGELRQTGAVEKNNPSEIKEEYRPAILNHTNQGLTALHSKFVLSLREVMIETSVGVSTYFLRKEFAQTNETSVPLKYIVDSEGAPFEEDIIKILDAYDANGDVMFIDDLEEDNSFFTVQYDALQIPDALLGQRFAIIVQNNHYKLTGTNPCEEIHVPPFFEEALQYYVASKTMSGFNSPELAVKGQEYMGYYMNSLNDAINMDIARTSVTSNQTKLMMRGFK